MKKILTFSFALAVFSLQPVASAQSAGTFMTVDAVNVSSTEITVTGVVQGAVTPSNQTITFFPGISETAQIAARQLCHRQLLLALSRPGQYVVRAGYNLCNVALVAP